MAGLFLAQPTPGSGEAPGQRDKFTFIMLFEKRTLSGPNLGPIKFLEAELRGQNVECWVGSM